MKRRIVIFVVVVVLSLSSICCAEKGYIVYFDDMSDTLIIETDMGYTCCDMFGFALLNVGDGVYGDLNSYGMQDLYDYDADEEFTAYIDDWGVSAREARRYAYDRMR